MENNNKKKDNIKVDNLNDRIKAALKNKNEKKGSQNVLKSNSKTEPSKLKESKFAIKNKNANKTGKEANEKIQLTAQEQKKFEKKKAARKYVHAPIDIANDSIQKKIKSSQEEIEAEDNPAHAAYLKISDKANKKVEKGVTSLNNSIGAKKDLKIEKKIVDKRDNYKLKKNSLSDAEKKAVQKKRIKRMYAKKRTYEEAERQGIFPSRIGRKNKEKKENRVVDKIVSVALWIFILLFSIISSGVIIVIILLLTIVLGIINVGGSVWSGGNADIDSLEYAWLWKEAELRQNVAMVYNEAEAGVDTENGDYVIIHTDSIDIGHNMFALMSYYAAKYGKIDEKDLKKENEELIGLVYPANPLIEAKDPFVIPQTTSTVYEYYITLEKNSLEEILESRLEDDTQREAYQRYIITAGGKQSYSEPVSDWDHYILDEPHFGCYYDSATDKIVKDSTEMTLGGTGLAGQPVMAMATGEITNIYPDDTGVYYVIEGIGNNKKQKYIISGLSAYTVNIGDYVEKGTKIGNSGPILKISTYGADSAGTIHFNYDWHNPEYLIN